MPIVEQPGFEGFAARVAEITSTHAAWHRRLWRSGTVQIARELLDESIRPGVKESAVADQRTYLTESLAADHGVPDRGASTQDVLKGFKPGITDTTHAWIGLSEHVNRMQDKYLENWALAFESTPNPRFPIDTEGAARRITAHLLDSGMHKNSIYAWLRAIQSDPTTVLTISDFIRQADERIRKPLRTYTFCVPVKTTPSFPADATSNWMSSSETAAWKSQYAKGAAPVRHQGSFILTAKAHDVNAAADSVRATIGNLVTKFQLGVKNPINICALMWSKEKGSDFPTQTTNRTIDILAFERLGKVAELTMPDYIINTLALLQPLRTGAPHLAIVSGWSAIESLLVGPLDHDIFAAERFSRIVAASMLRAELSWLSTSYHRNNTGSAAAAMRDCVENIERARLFQMHLAANSQVDLGSTADNLALQRIRPALRDPQREMLRIGNILRREFTRLYRKRNMIVHGGQIHESNLAPVSETMTPLIGAGIDRFVHVGLKFGIPPIQLSALAEARIHYLRPATVDSPGNLLDILEMSRE